MLTPASNNRLHPAAVLRPGLPFLPFLAAPFFEQILAKVSRHLPLLPLPRRGRCASHAPRTSPRCLTFPAFLPCHRPRRVNEEPLTVNVTGDRVIRYQGCPALRLIQLDPSRLLKHVPVLLSILGMTVGNLIDRRAELPRHFTFLYRNKNNATPANKMIGKFWMVDATPVVID